ncbi:hypothetical protein Pla110_03640 [Polystyrenella longa]|uniref:Uncharacterized protein n=1 Tax=Polystyrenella longa TaxID=2528007 RepID=A0A518CHG6_9PLAN|nr:hypothetical protein [Polystyrenella longa]QDU78660.1 hypothetical protein Pla110_03640 [Polystyrenella longa]
MNFIHSIHYRSSLLYSGLLLGLLTCSSTLIAGPSTQDPTQLYEVRDEEMSQYYWERSRDAIDIILMVTKKIEDARAIGDISVVSPREVSEAYVMVEELTFCAGKLGQFGEPCARHFLLVSSDAKGTLLRFIRDYLEIPNVKDQLYSEQTQSRLKKVVKEQASKVKKLQAMIKRQEWRDLDETIHGIYLEVWRYLCWYPDEKVEDPVLKQIFELRPEYNEEINEWFRQEADEILTQLSEQHTPAFPSVLQSMNDSLVNIEQNGRVVWDNSEVTGPEWVELFTERIKQAQVEALKYVGIQVSHLSSNPQIKTSLEIMMKSQRQFMATAIEGIAQAIQKDAVRVSGIEAETLYREYLGALTGLLALIEDQELVAPIEPAMQELAAKSESFTKDVATYSDVTGDLLRWRERKATAQVARARTLETQEEYISLSELFKSEKIGKQERTRGEDIDVELRTWIDELRFIDEEFISKPVYVDDLVLSEQRQRLLSPVREHYCATVEMPKAASTELSYLMTDLQANASDSFPLSIKAQLAIYRALHYDFYQVGGELTEVEFESRITQFARSSPSDLARERLFQFEERINPESFRVRNATIGHIKPHWVRHQYFFSHSN